MMFLSIIFILLSLSGCGIYNDIVNQKSDTKEEDTIVLNVLAGQSTSDAGIEDMIDEVVAEKFPNVKLEWDCVDWGDKFASQMYARCAAGEEPDIIIGKAQDVYAYAPGGNLAPISKDCYEKIEKRALDSVTLDGIVYGLPYDAFYQGVIYNKNIFDKYQLQPPKTLEDLEYIILKLKKNKVTPFAGHFQESWKIGNMTMQFLMNDIFSSKQNWGELFRQGKYNFSGNEAVLHSLEQNESILENSWQDAMGIDQYECDKRFIQGEAAMYLTGSWSLQSIVQYNTSNEYGIFPYPNQKGNAKLIHETNMTFMKSANTQYSEMIDQIFEELVTNKKLIENILEFTQAYPVTKDIKTPYRKKIDSDIQAYEEKNQVIEVTIGNSQLVWTFQDDLAQKQQEWLRGTLSLKEVLNYADQHRIESSNGE